MAQHRLIPTLQRWALAWLLLPMPFAQAGVITLYDNGLGDQPQQQAWLTGIGIASVSATAEGVSVDTRLFNALAFGYFNHTLEGLPDDWSLKNPAFPSLDATEGFTLGFELRISDEDHVSSSRAGFSVILLGMDVFGIELGFWEDSIWAQSGPSFDRDEAASFDTTASGLVLYELTILGTDYFLDANGTQILTGATRDYSSATPSPDPYGTPNMLFLGDDTGSAGAAFTLGSIRLTSGLFDAGLPAPFALILIGLAWFARRRTRG